MSDKRYSGVQTIAFSDTLSGTRSAIAGKLSSQSSIDLDNIKSETTDSHLWGGQLVKADLLFLDDQDYDTIVLMMVADEEKYWHFIYKDGHELSTAEPINPFAKIGTGLNARDGVIAWSMDFEKFAHVPILILNAGAAADYGDILSSDFQLIETSDLTESDFELILME